MLRPTARDSIRYPVRNSAPTPRPSSDRSRGKQSKSATTPAPGRRFLEGNLLRSAMEDAQVSARSRGRRRESIQPRNCSKAGIPGDPGGQASDARVRANVKKYLEVELLAPVREIERPTSASDRRSLSLARMLRGTSRRGRSESSCAYVTLTCSPGSKRRDRR